MYQIPLSEIKEKILSSGKLNQVELEQRLKQKINDLAGLISEEGAACIIANELGIELVKTGEKLKIKELYAGMRDVSTIGKVIRKFETREFTREGRAGRVCSLIIGDETGTIKLVLWNDQVDNIKNINENDLLLVKNGYVKENNDFKEIHLGDRGSLNINPAGENIATVRESVQVNRRSINELQKDEDNVEILGTVVQVFDPRFFSVCPRCRSRINETPAGFSCSEHGQVQPESSYVMNLIFDDGTGTIRTVFWKNQINHLLNKTETEVIDYKNDLPRFESVKNDLLGEQYKLRGRVRRNEMFERIEFNVQLVEKANPSEELARLQNKS